MGWQTHIFAPSHTFNAEGTWNHSLCPYQQHCALFKRPKASGETIIRSEWLQYDKCSVWAPLDKLFRTASFSPRAKINQKSALNAPADALTVVQQNGWMNSDIFVACLKVFFCLVQPSPKNIHRLNLSGYSSYKDHLLSVIPNIHNYVHMPCIPSHTVHELLPLERIFKAA